MDEPVEVLNRVTKIVIYSIVFSLICISVVAVITVINSFNVNKQNEDLRVELQCLRDPAFEADKADSTLNLVLARAIAALADNREEELVNLGQQLSDGADRLEKALENRENSLTQCQT